jgi:hypothetical protein
MKTPKLKAVDLSKCFSKENDCSFHDHKGINGRRSYLAKIGGFYYAGKFERVWFGWTFDGWNGTPLQLDMPGTNSSMWQGLWEIRQ